MAIVYGKRYDLPKLLSSEVGTLPTASTDERTNVLDYVNIGVTVLEFLAAFIPGVGPAISLGIGVANTAAYTGIKASDPDKFGEIDTFDYIGIGAQLFGGGGFARQVSKGFKVASELSSHTPFWKGLDLFYNAEGFPDIAKAFSVSDRVIPKVGTKLKLGSSTNVSKLLEKEYTKLLGSQNISELGLKTTVKEVSESIGKSSLLTANRAGQAVNTISNIAETSEKLEKSTFVATKELSELLGLSLREYRQLSRLLKTAGSAKARSELLELFFARIGKTKNLLKFRFTKGNLGKLYQNLKHLSNINISKTLREYTDILIKKLFKGFQYISNPSTLVSKVVEKTAAKITEKIAEKTKVITDKIALVIKKGAKAEKELEDLWLKEGGVIIGGGNSTVMGYKLLSEEAQLVVALVKFRASKTGSKTGKNVGGKKDVIIRTDALTLRKFAKSAHPMLFYLNNWAKNRGGRHATKGEVFGDVIGYLDAAFGYLPIDKIGEYVGMLSYGASVFKNIDKVPWVGTDVFVEKFMANLQQSLYDEAFKAGAAFVPGRIGRAFTERAAKGVITNQQGLFTSGVQQFQSEMGSIKGKTASGKSIEKVQSIKGSGMTMKSLF